ncbi:MAG: peptide deformylase [Patescibacteria group bacterium]|nr:MAG: peptide deformylase [Patescibacteria group bacterium]
MSILALVIHPNDILRAVSGAVPIEAIKNYRQLVLDMKETMIARRGIGLAAPQVGQNIRLIIVQTKDGPQALFNPEIKDSSEDQEWGEEGCLSIPGVFGDVERHKKIQCEYFNEFAEPKKLEAEGLMARVIQHEIDHLNGILFIDKGKNIHQN